MKRKVAHLTSPTKAIAKPPVTAKGTPAVRPENQAAGAQRMASRVAKKKAPAQAATPPAGADQPPATKAVLTTVVVKTDVGFGNTLFIRGQGDGLSWDQGIPLRCVDSSTWVWSTAEAKESLCFKLLLNDRTWSQGENLTAPAGRKTEVSPVF